MTPESPYQSLCDHIARTREALAYIDITLVQDPPTPPPIENGSAREGASVPHLVSQLEDEVVGMMALLNRAELLAQRASSPIAASGRSTAIADMAALDHAVHEVARLYVEKLADHRTGMELDEMAARLNDAWPPWNAALRVAIQDVWPALYGTLRSIGGCWAHLVDANAAAAIREPARNPISAARN